MNFRNHDYQNNTRNTGGNAFKLSLFCNIEDCHKTGTVTTAAIY